MQYDPVDQQGTETDNEYFLMKKSTIPKELKNNFKFHANEIAGKASFTNYKLQCHENVIMLLINFDIFI